MRNFGKTWMFGLAMAASVSLVGCNGNTVNNTATNATQSVSNAASDVAKTLRNTTNTVKNTVKVATQDPHGVGLADINHADLNSALGNKIVSQHLAKKAYVYTVKKRAFVAVELSAKNASELTSSQKNAIISVVKKSDKNINSVYVTARPDVFQRFESFFRDAKMGKPASDWWSSFKNTINNAFPQTKTERY